MSPQMVEYGRLTDIAAQLLTPCAPLPQTFADLGYSFNICSASYEVWFNGERIGVGHSQSTTRRDMRPASVKMADMRQCATWVAERHYRRHNGRQ